LNLFRGVQLHFHRATGTTPEPRTI
jgi:hypothetical protein